MTADPSRKLTRGKRMVEDSAELRRILALPRRKWEEQAALYAEKVSAYLRSPGGQQTLRTIQAASLVEASDNKGLLAPISVGGGKTLLSFLLFLVLESRRPLLLLPAKLIEKTHREMARYRQHWLIPGYIRIESYEKLGRPQHVNMLNDAQPDVIVADEAHRLKSVSAACTKRARRYMHDQPHTIFVGMSGTVMKRSLLDYAHLVGWALRDRAPAPLTYEDRMMWSLALDDKRDTENKLAPGALVQMCTLEEQQAYVRAYNLEDSIEMSQIVRKAYQRRLTETPGVVASTYKPGDIGASLRIEQVPLKIANPVWQEAVRRLRSSWELPDGTELMDGIELWRHMREIGCGFFYRWNPQPPKPWRDARRNWASFVREVLKTNRSAIDSESQVVRAVDDGLYDARWLKAWREVKETFTPKTEAVWLDYTVIDFCANWLHSKATEVEKDTQGGVCWVEHTEFGKLLAQRSGLPYYHRKGLNEKGQAIESHRHGHPLIASIASNAEGRNLQGWSRALVPSIPQSGATHEQLYGRHHRDGQMDDEVVFQFTTTVEEQLASFQRAQRDARVISDTTGHEQKLCYADIVLDDGTPKK